MTHANMWQAVKKERMKHKFLYLIVLLLLVACGEEKESFVIKGTINNLGGRPLYALYQSETGIVVDTLRPYDGKVEMRGISTEVVPVQLYFMSWRPFMRLYLCNGERVELKGDAEKMNELQMKGSALNRRLWKFISQHYEIFNDAHIAALQSERNTAHNQLYNEKRLRLDSLLTDYITHHPSDEVSAILIGDYLLRYDNYALCDSLWQQLNEKARMPYIAHTMQHLSEELTYNAENSKLPYMRMLDNTDSIRYVSSRNSKATLLCLWQAEDKNSDVLHKVLQHYARRYSKPQLQVVAISCDRDTALWHRVVDSDTSRVVDFWNDGLYTSAILEKFKVTRLPVYMLGDSLGNILVRTTNLPDKDLDAQLDSLMSIDKYKIKTPIFIP